MSKAIELANKWPNTDDITDMEEVGEEMAKELRRLAAIEQKYLAIMAQEPVKAIDNRTDMVVNWYASLAHITMDGSELRYNPLYTLNKPD